MNGKLEKIYFLIEIGVIKCGQLTFLHSIKGGCEFLGFSF